MPAKKIIAVTGATGAQGGGLVRAVLADADGEFAVRALTRDPTSDKAKALADAGAEVVAADLDDPASVERAFQGAYGAFCVTFFWNHFSPERELAEAQIMADKAKLAGLKHVVWSTLEDTRLRVAENDPQFPTLMGKYKVPHLDAKGEADRFFTDAGLPASYLLTSFYWENLIYFGMAPKADESGKLVFTLPMADKKLAQIAAEDIGRCAYGLFRRGPNPGERVGIAGAHLTGAEMAAAMSKAFGRDIVYQDVPVPVYRSFGFPGADDLASMFQANQNFAAELTSARSLDVSRALNPQLQSFEDWLAANASRIPLG